MSNERLSVSALRKGDRVTIRNETREGTVLVDGLRLALDPWARFRGLLGTSELVPADGLLLRPCRAIHTCFMRYPIDVVFVDRAAVVVGVLHELRPWRFSDVYASALATLELPAGTVEMSNTRVGDQLSFVVR